MKVKVIIELTMEANNADVVFGVVDKLLDQGALQELIEDEAAAYGHRVKSKSAISWAVLGREG